MHNGQWTTVFRPIQFFFFIKFFSGCNCIEFYIDLEKSTAPVVNVQYDFDCGKIRQPSKWLAHSWNSHYLIKYLLSTEY